MSKLYIVLLCLITAIVLLAFLGVVVCFDNRGKRRRWLVKLSHHHRHRHSVPIPPVAADRSVHPGTQSRKWVVLWLLMTAVGLVGLFDLSIIVDHKTRGKQWFLINWRSFNIHW